MSRRLLALYGAITVLLAYPLSIDPARRVLSTSPDTDLFMWILAWDAHALATSPLQIFNANIYYPQALTLAYSENLIGSSLIAAPVLWMTGNPVLAMNLVALVSCVLNAMGAVSLARRLGITTTGATLSGLIYAFAPPLFLRLDQLHLVALPWMPFALGRFHSYLDRGRRRDLWLTILFFVLQALTSGHGAVFAAVSLGIVFVWRLSWGARIDFLRLGRDIGWQGILIATPLMASIVPYVNVQREMGLRRTLEDWAVPASSFLASPSHAQVALLSLFLPDARINETAGAYLFPGVLPIVLAALAFLLPRPLESSAGSASLRTRLADPRVCYAAITLLALWLAAGPPIGLWPFVYWLPGLNFIRAPSRFVLLAVLGLAMLAGFGFDRLSSRVSGSRGLAVAVAVLLLAEFAAFPLGTEPYRLDIPPADRWLATQPAPFVVAELPLADSRDINRRERRQTLFMLHSTAHWQKTVHGYSGVRPALHSELYQLLLGFPDDRSVSSLENLGVTFVVVHRDLYAADEWAAVDARLHAFAERLSLVHEDDSGRVYRLQKGR